MKRIISLALCLIFTLTLCSACSIRFKTPGDEPAASTASPSATTPDNGILEITVPANLLTSIPFSEAESYAESIGATVAENPDGSYTYTLTPEQRQTLLDDQRAGFEAAIAQMMESGQYPEISDIKYNEDFSELQILCDQTSAKQSELFALAVGVFGGMAPLYQAYEGKGAAAITTVYLTDDATGETFLTLTSPEDFLADNGYMLWNETEGGPAETEPFDPVIADTSFTSREDAEAMLISNYKIALDYVADGQESYHIEEMRCDSMYALVINDQMIIADLTSGKAYYLSISDKTGQIGAIDPAADEKAFSSFTASHLFLHLSYEGEKFSLLTGKEFLGRDTTVYAMKLASDSQTYNFWIDDEYGLTLKYTVTGEGQKMSMEVTELIVGGVTPDSIVDLSEYTLTEIDG